MDNDELVKSYINKYINSDELFKDKFKSMLIDYMLKNVKTIQKSDEFVLVLFRLCAETRPNLLNQSDFYTNLPLKYCLLHIPVLYDYGRFHSAAIIYYLVNQYEDAFNIWKELVF